MIHLTHTHKIVQKETVLCTQHSHGLTVLGRVHIEFPALTGRLQSLPCRRVTIITASHSLSSDV